jgi:spermidine synthase
MLVESMVLRYHFKRTTIGVPLNNWLNYIKNKKCIYKSQNEIHVYENKRFRWIAFDARFVQSLMDKKNPKKIIIPYLQTIMFFQNHLPGNTCLMGLGAGSAVLHLNQEDYQLTIVEILPDMIDIAEKFFYFNPAPNIDVHCMCAKDFIKQTDKNFKHIILDLGDATGFPNTCKSKDFFQNLYHHLETKGVLALNLTQFSEIDYFKPLMKEIFGQNPLIIENHGNWLLFIAKQAPHDYLLSIMQSKHYLKTFFWHAMYGAIATIEKPWIQKAKIFISQLRS